MSQVSTEEFDLLFQDKKDTERQIKSFTRYLDRVENKIESLKEGGITIREEWKLKRLEFRQSWAVDRITGLEEEASEIDSILPQDKFSFNKFRRNLTNRNREIFSCEGTIQDSPYYDDFVGGDGFKVRMSGKTGRGSRKVTYNFKGEPEMFDNVTSFRVGGSAFGTISRMDTGSITLLTADNEVLYNYDFSNVI